MTSTDHTGVSTGASAGFDRRTVLGAARCFQHCVRNGDLGGAFSSVHEDAVYVTEPGHFVRGHAALRPALANLCSMKPDIHLAVRVKPRRSAFRHEFTSSQRADESALRLADVLDPSGPRRSSSMYAAHLTIIDLRCAMNCARS